MAIKEVKQYYYAMQAQYLEMKADLADFEQGLQDGYITEDQLEAAKEEINLLENNYDRLSYILYLLEIPNKNSKKAKHKKTSQQLLTYFDKRNATEEAVKAENKSALDTLRAELKKLKEVGN